jgi:hypothetical protein
VDLSLHKLTTNSRKHLMQGALFKRANWWAEMVMDVNKPGELRDDLL